MIGWNRGSRGLLAAAALLAAGQWGGAAYAQNGTVQNFGEGAIALADGSGVRFRVYAPNAATISVAGDFNSWSDSAHPLVKDGEGYWSATVSAAAHGDRYKYVVNGDLWRKDPWSFQVEGSGEDANSVIVDFTQYQRKSTDWQTPPVEDLVIYQMHVKGFQYNNDGLAYVPGKVFRDFVDTKLDYLVDLGVNAVHLMPINEFPGEASWGYNPVFYHATESSYGTPLEFMELVDECHARGIAVIVGVVYNHTAGNDNVHYWDFDGTAFSEFGGNGYFYYTDERALTFWGPEPNYGHPRTRERFFENTRLLADVYKVDGFRMDAVGFVRKESGDGNDWGGGDVEEGWQFLRDFNNVARSHHNGRFISIAEDIANETAITKNASEGGAGFLSQWAETNMRYIMSQSDDANRSIDDVKRILGYWYGVNYGLHELVKYHSSHDKVGALNDGPRLPVLIGDPSAWFTRARTRLANGIILSSPGIPLIFMGDEKYSVRSFSEHAGEGLDWTLRDRNRDFYEYSRDLIALKTTTGALRANNLEIPAEHLDNKLVNWRRWGNNGEVIVYAANFAYNDQSFWIPFPSQGNWHTILNSNWNHYGGEDPTEPNVISVNGEWVEIQVPGYGMVAFSKDLELAPGRVWNVAPGNGGSAPSAGTVTLDWQDTSRAQEYHIYVGLTQEAVASATGTSPEYMGTRTQSDFTLHGLAENELRFWRVDAVNAKGATPSEVFRFTTPTGEIGVSGRISWTPAQPVAGQEITVTYDVAGGPLAGAAAVTAHQGITVGGDDWQRVVQTPMIAAGGGQFRLTMTIPQDAEFIDLAFFNQDEQWDNNGGQDWHIAVQQPQPQGPLEQWMVF